MRIPALPRHADGTPARWYAGAIVVLANAAIFALLALASCAPAPREWGNSFVLYEDGSFELLEDGVRIGSGCLDGQPCDDSRGANVHQLPLPAPGTSAAR